MATIKLTGFRDGRQATVGDTDDATIAGSLAIGDDATEDTLTVNAEFTSDLVPDATNTYDLGSAVKKWRHGYFEQVNANQRHINTAKYTSDETDARYVRWDAAGSNGSAGVNTKFVAPANGILLSVSIRTTSPTGSTDINFHKASNGSANLNSTPVETQTTAILSANTTREVTFSSSSFSAGDILGLSVQATTMSSSPETSVNVTCVWLFDWNA